MSTTSTKTEKVTLYSVALEKMEIDDILYENFGEMTPELEERLAALLRVGPRKIDAACMVVRELESSENACLTESKRLSDRADMFAGEAKRLKARILGAVDAAFSGKLKTDMFTVWGQTSAPTVAFDVVPDADLAEVQKVYPEVVRTKYELDKQTLKSMRAQGEALPAAVTVTEGEGTRYLRIK